MTPADYVIVAGSNGLALFMLLVMGRGIGLRAITATLVVCVVASAVMSMQLARDNAQARLKREPLVARLVR